MLTILPPPACRMAGTTALQQFQMPLTFTAIAASHSASLIVSNRPPLRPPKSAALLMSASMRPNASSAVRASSIAEAAFATSSLAQTAVPFSRCTRSSVWAQSLMSAMMTRAPRLPKNRAYSCPIPRAAPVITMTLPSTFMAGSLHRLDAEVVGNCRDFLALLLGRLRELGRPANVGDLSGGGEAIANQRIGCNDRPNIRGDALAKFIRHAGWAEEADQAIECELGITGLLDRRNSGRSRGADAVRDRQQLDFSGLKLWPHDRQRRHIHLHASLGEIVGGLDRVAIGDFGHRQVLAFEKTSEQEIERPGHSRPIELARMVARQRDQVRQRPDIQRNGHRDGDHRIGHSGDRQQITRPVRQVLVEIGMGGK